MLNVLSPTHPKQLIPRIPIAALFILSFICIYIYICKHLFFVFLHGLSSHSFSSLFLFFSLLLCTFPDQPSIFFFFFFGKVPVVDVSCSRYSIRRVQIERQNKREDRQRVKKESNKGVGTRERSRGKGERFYAFEYLVSRRLIPDACFVKDVNHGLTYFIGFPTRFSSSIDRLTFCLRFLAFRL